MLVNDPGADLHVRAWRFSYNARGIIEMPTTSTSDTAIIMVHPWGIDDGQGWITPEPAGVCDFCTPQKNHYAAKHTHNVINPFLKAYRGEVAFVMSACRETKTRSARSCIARLQQSQQTLKRRKARKNWRQS